MWAQFTHLCKWKWEDSLVKDRARQGYECLTSSKIRGNGHLIDH